MMKYLDDILYSVKEYQVLETSLQKGRTPAMATGLSGVHKAHLIHTIHTNLKKRALVLASDEAEAVRICSDLEAMGTKAVMYSARDYTFKEVVGVSHEFEHKRIAALYSYMTGQADVIVSCIDAALQYTIPPLKLMQSTIQVKEGENMPLEKIISVLLSGGYMRVEQVEGSGQFAVRGGILDFFMPTSENPCRVEFWGDEIDTISSFSIESQRRSERLESFAITPACEILFDDKEKLCEAIRKKAGSLRGKTAEAAKKILLDEAEKIKNGVKLTSIDKYYSLIYSKPATIFDYISGQDMIFVSEQPKLRERIKANFWQFSEDIKDYLLEGTLCKGLDTFSGDMELELENLRNHSTVFIDNFARGSCELPLKELVNFNFRQLSGWSGSVNILCEDLETIQAADKTCVILAGTEKFAKNLVKDLQYRNIPCQFLQNDKKIEEKEIDISSESLSPISLSRWRLKLGKGIYIASGSLSAGFEYPSADFVLITHSQISSVQKRKEVKKKKSKEIFSLAELSVGEYVVHSTYGIGQFDGVQKIEAQGVTKDYLKIKYAKGDVLYVPVTQLDLVAKYIGPKDETSVHLNRLNSGEWLKAKTRVRKVVKDIAKQLIKLYAQRMNIKGHAFPADNEWQADFESKFEYEETADQKKCIYEIKEDMEKAVPMDRLLCGDVGFGKTEVALRAAFKCVTDSKQCVFLCPTTILAWQHYQTVQRRFEGFPINIELLSRFRTPEQQKKIIQKLKRGDIDIIIGTHKLLNKDIVFRDLGLAIIDEEQRFGVEQKESFKSKYKNVDILTLSATPIPRTLNMAMSGIRDMSLLEEAPQDRHPIQSYVLEYDTAVINEAIRRELRRGGQVFYLFNSVEGIEEKARELQERIPEAKVAYGHGKMNEQQLSEVWRKMLEQEINVLVSTTIIETGVDIPNANTLIIENSDRMGLSQLHQIRGRVGRSSRRAYAYFTFQQNKVLTEVSHKRLEAIKEFTEFGSGMKIAMRDLEIRGAGDLLGAMQHGHITDVGYDMYMKLLNEAVLKEKGEETADVDLDCLVDIKIEAHIPEKYISNMSQRLEIYRRIADIRNEEDASDVLDELIDRFGDVPKAVKGLIEIALVRSRAKNSGIYEIRQQNENLLLYIINSNCSAVEEILGRFPVRAKLVSEKKQYLSVKILKNDTAADTLNEIFGSKIGK